MVGGGGSAAGAGARPVSIEPSAVSAATSGEAGAGRFAWIRERRRSWSSLAVAAAAASRMFSGGGASW
jgi:hypothetical protein